METQEQAIVRARHSAPIGMDSVAYSCPIPRQGNMLESM